MKGGIKMNICKYLLVVLTISAALIFPYTAFADKQIPFCACYDDNNSGSCDPNEVISDSGNPDLLIGCTGPWLRESNNDLIKPGQSICPFYTVDVTIFSPYGKWTCNTFLPDVDPVGVAQLIFTLTKDIQKVDLILTNDSIVAKISKDEPVVTAAAALGDDNKRPKRDRDTFTFNFGPNPSDGVVKVTLEENPESGHAGEEATLILQSGNSNIEVNSGKLPLEITQELSGDAEYKLIVEQHGIPEDLRFRGKYFLTVEKESGQIEEIRPSFDVEQ